MFVRRRTRSCDAQRRGERAAKSPPRSPRAILLPTLVPTRAASAARSPNSLPLKGGARAPRDLTTREGGPGSGSSAWPPAPSG